PTDGSSLYLGPSAPSDVITIDEGVLLTARVTDAGGAVKHYLTGRSWMRYGGAWGWKRMVPEIPGGGTELHPAPVPGAGVVVVDQGGSVWLYRSKSWYYEWVPLGIPGDDRGEGNPAAPPEAHLRWAPRLAFMSTLLAAHVDNPAGENHVWSRAGRDLDFDARPMGGWTDRRLVDPRGVGVETQGLGIAVGHVNPGDRPDLVLLYVNNPPGANELWYRVGWELDAEGNASSWSVPRRVPLRVAEEVAEADIALADLDGDGRPELVIAYATRGAGWQRVFYRIGWRLNVSGEVEGGWSDSVEVPGLKQAVHGVGVAVVDMNDDDRPDLVIFTLDAESGGSVGRYRIGRAINARGHVTGGWSGALAVGGDPFPASHQGAGIAIADFSGSRLPDLVVFTVENGPTDNVGWYRIGRDITKRGNARTWSEPRRIPGWFGWENQGAALTVADVDPALVEKRVQMGTDFKRAAARHQGRVLDAQWAARTDPPAPVAADALAEQARAQMEPWAAVTERVSARVELDEQWQGAADTLRPLLAAPEFPQPMYEALRDLGQEHLFPGWDTVPPETVTLLRTNPTFIEAFMVGLNHELARELLWREFPADRRATFFRHFWDVRGAAATAGPLTDIPPIESWGPERELGGSATAVGSADMLVLAIRGEVLRRYPTATVYARRARWDGDRRALDGEVRLPQFRGRMEPDLLLFGLPLTVPQALGDDEDAGWFFVLQQQPTEPRFGLDALPERDAYGGAPAAWSALHWGHLAADRDGLEAIVHVPVEASRLAGMRLPLRPDLPAGEGSPLWGWNAAHLASITFQPPVQVAIHATDLIPREPVEWRVTGIVPAPEPESRIQALGGPRPEGGDWRLPVAEVIAALDRGEVFYVEEPAGDRVDLVVSRTAAGRRYVKTSADGDVPNNLLALPHLPEEG
ncbi:MAG TPA: DUF3892 domain-containing protein, partial [Longimicrobium sp.]|nr:DUF3892 domain-containing protein [Longimicrobium sp.]